MWSQPALGFRVDPVRACNFQVQTSAIVGAGGAVARRGPVSLFPMAASELSRSLGEGMKRSCMLLTGLLALVACCAAAQDNADQSETVCTFSDGRQMIVRYNPVPSDRKSGPPSGKIWMPGGAAITLFTETPVKLAQTELKTGAYTVYLVPGKNDWTLIVSKNTNPNSPYDQKLDLARSRMETGTLSQAEEHLNISFGHVAPKQCEINVDYGRSRAWVAFSEI